MNINNTLSSIKVSYKNAEDAIYKDDNEPFRPKGPRLSLYNIYIFELFITVYSFLIDLFHVKVKKKYIFVNTRHGDLIHPLDKKDVLVFGGKKDFLYCLKHGVSFKSVSFLIKAFDIYYYYNRNNSYVKALNLLNKLLSGNKEEQFIFLWDDLQKIGTSFAHVFRGVNSVKVVCIQHGLYTLNSGLVSSGLHSNYNFIFKSSQMKFIIGANKDNSFTMGLPYNISKPAIFKKNIYLVAGGGLGAKESKYFTLIQFFLRICEEFNNTEYTLYYRPHPNEDLKFCKKYFTNIDTTPKKNILNSFRAIYIGVNSTLLYEAKKFGNIVVKIEDKDSFPRINDFNADLSIDKDNIGLVLKNINKYIDNEYKTFTYKDTLDSNSRFMKCVNTINATSGTRPIEDPSFF